MNAYSVRTNPPGAFTGWRAEVDGAAIRGVGYGHTEREALRKAWTDYWSRADKAGA